MHMGVQRWRDGKKNRVHVIFAFLAVCAWFYAAIL